MNVTLNVVAHTSQPGKSPCAVNGTEKLLSAPKRWCTRSVCPKGEEAKGSTSFCWSECLCTLCCKAAQLQQQWWEAIPGLRLTPVPIPVPALLFWLGAVGHHPVGKGTVLALTITLGPHLACHLPTTAWHSAGTSQSIHGFRYMYVCKKWLCWLQHFDEDEWCSFLTKNGFAWLLTGCPKTQSSATFWRSWLCHQWLRAAAGYALLWVVVVV